MDTKTTALKNTTAFKRKLNSLFAQEKIMPKDIEDLNKLERARFGQAATKIVKELNGQERDDFLDKIDLVMHPTTRSDLWDYNHAEISQAISKYMQQYGVMPAQKDIAQQSGLSRQTVAKHFKDYKTTPEFTAHMEQFKFMAPQVLSSVFRFAAKGDMRAARLYFEMVGAINKQPANKVVNEQNNYIQINNTILSQENLKQLTAEQLTQIENIVTRKELKRIS